MIFYKRPKKSLGQNFLIDKNIIKKIVNIGKISNKTVVIEIGAGTGNMTNEIIKLNPKKIILIEKDEKLAKILEEKFEKNQNVQVINKDILEYIEDELYLENVIVYGNLPYNISTQIISKLISLNKWPPWYSKLIFMFQKEVAERIIAKSGSENFNRLAVLCNWRLNIEKHFNISNNCFAPKPKINSSLLSFKPKKNFKSNIKNPKNLEFVTRILFANPRKMINKNLLKLFKKNLITIKNMKINVKSRPKELSSEMYYKITSSYEKLFK